MIDAASPSTDGRMLRRMAGSTLRALLLLASVVSVAACSSDATGPGDADPDPQPGNPDPYDHTLAPGASSEDLLSGAEYDSLVVEIQYVEGFRPTDEGLAHLQSFLAERLNKARGIEIRIAPALQIQTQATYSVADVQAIEEEHRSAYTEGSTLAVYFLFLDGEYSEQANVLGFAHRNTSMAIFQEKIEDNSGGVTQPSQATVEGVVLQHEIGHNLGLVDNGSPMQTEHQDEPNGKHCDDENCLMYYAVRTADFIQNLLDGMPDLDQDCIDDLQANGGK